MTMIVELKQKVLEAAEAAAVASPVVEEAESPSAAVAVSPAAASAVEAAGHGKANRLPESLLNWIV